MLLGAYTASLLAINADIVVDLVRLALANHTSSHVVLVPFVTATLLFQERASIAAARRPAWIGGLGLIGAGFVVLMLGRSSVGGWSPEHALSLSVGGVIVMWLGGFLATHGPGACRVGLFPLLFLVAAIPPPAAVVAVLTEILKRGTTETVDVLFALTGTVNHRQDFVFSLPGVAIEVADECSGIRSSIALMLTGLVASHMFLRRAGNRAVLLLAVLPIAVLKNAIRIVVLSLLTLHVDPGYLEGQLHHEGGVVFLLVAMAMLLPILQLLRKVESGGVPPVDVRTPA